MVEKLIKSLRLITLQGRRVKLLTTLLTVLFLAGCAATPNVPNPLPQPEPVVLPDCSATIDVVKQYMNKRAVDFVNQEADILVVKTTVSDYKCINEMLARVVVDIYMEYMSPLPGKEDGPKVKWCGTMRIEALAMSDGISYFKFEPQSVGILELDICN